MNYGTFLSEIFHENVKKLLLLLLALRFFAPLAAVAQNTPFLFQSLSQQPYADLVQPVQSLNNGALWDRNSAFATQLGFAFIFRNQPITSVNVYAHAVQFIGFGNMSIAIYFAPGNPNLIRDRGIANATTSGLTT